MKLILYTLKKIKAGVINGETQEIVAQSGILKSLMNHECLKPMSVADYNKQFHSQTSAANWVQAPRILIDSQIIDFDKWYNTIRNGVLNKGLSKYKIAEYHFAELNMLDAYSSQHQTKWFLVSYTIHADAVEMPNDAHE